MSNESNLVSMIDIEKMQAWSRQFVKDREWEKFHTPKNIAIGIAVEAAELNEIFIWLTDQQSIEIANDPKTLQKVKDEIADIFHYMIRLTDLLGVDLTQAFWEKMHKVEKKYPPESVKGSANAYANHH